MTKQIEQLVDKLASYIEQRDVLNTNVSNASIGWHLAHCLLTINAITYRLSHSNPKLYKSSLNLKKFILFTLGKIPRGKSQSPSHVVPKGETTVEILQEHIAQAYKSLLLLPSLEDNHFFSHPLFGQVNKKGTIKFLTIHTKHHLAIMEDIANA